MRNILFYLLILTTYLSVGQIKDSVPVFEYEIRYSLGKALVKKGYVFKNKNKIYFNTTKATFLEEIPKFIENNDEGMPEINTFSKGVVNENITVNIKSDSLFSVDSASSNAMVVKEKLLKQKWLPTGVEKIISERNCLEFTTKFRGRFYTACIDISIPFYYGPWKFNNLPGLLISIEDSKNQLSWKLLNIKYISKEEIEAFINEQEAYLNNLNEILLIDFVALYDASEGGTVSIISSRLPRGFAKKASKKWKRVGRELMYEWEKQ